MFWSNGFYARVDPKGKYLRHVVRAENLIESVLPQYLQAWLDGQSGDVKQVAFRLLTTNPRLFVQIVWLLWSMRPEDLPDAANGRACAQLLMRLAQWQPPAPRSLQEHSADVTAWRHGGEEMFQVGGFSFKQDFLQGLLRNLRSPKSRARYNAQKDIRGTDNTFSQNQTLIYAPWILQNREAIRALALQIGESEAIFSLERGGSLVADHIMAHLRRKPVNTKLPKSHRNDQIARFKDAIRSHIGVDTPGRQATISVTETVVGGTSANTILRTIPDLLKSHSQLQIQFLFERHTWHKDDQHVPLFEEMRIAAQASSFDVFPGEHIKVPGHADAHRVSAFLAAARYLLGEDVGYQLAYDGQHAGEPLIVFNQVGQYLRAVHIQPSGGRTAREILIRLVLGVYDDFLESENLL
ncbi:MAG TPA: hypothetical protein VGR02_05510 [Thermoanaerobaculia bacterium]|jgi:hypothetical protein|nr:hypothetical protein [Thermoanaerobaculia bacterium]